MAKFGTFTGQFGTPINPGELRHQITYQQRTVSGQDSFGDDVAAWPDFATVKASVRGLVGRELLAAQQLFAEARWKVEHHYVPGITPEMRISWYVDGQVKTLDVIGLGDPEGQSRIQTVYAKDHEE